MGADLDAMLLGELHGLAHVIEVGGMEAASDVRRVDKGHQAFVVAHPVESEGLAHVAINDNHLSLSFYRLLHSPEGKPPTANTALGAARCQRAWISGSREIVH